MSQFQTALEDAKAVLELLRQCESSLDQAARWCVEAFEAGGKLMLCGNGGSAAEAQHMAGELIGRYKKSRAPLAALALGTDVATATCIVNDYSFHDIFERQLRALAQPHDVLVVFTTSGNSQNVVACLQTAREKQIRSIAFLGKNGGRAKDLSDCILLVRHEDTARIQEGHQFLMHCLMDQIESAINRPENSGD